MGRRAIVAIVAGVAVVVLIGGFLFFQYGRPAFNASFDESFMENCLKSARDAAAKQGNTGPDVDASFRQRCTCALDVVKPLPDADKIALGSSEAKQREVLAEIQKRCQ